MSRASLVCSETWSDESRFAASLIARWPAASTSKRTASASARSFSASASPSAARRDRLGAVGGGLLLGVGLDLDPDRRALGLARRVDQLDPLDALGDLGLAGGADPFLGGDRLGPGLVGLGPGLAFLAALVLDRDLLLLAGDLDRLGLGDLRLLDDPVGLDLLALSTWPLGASIRASSASRWRSACCWATSASWAARRTSTSRSCSSRANSVSRPISKLLRAASRFFASIWTRVSCSMSLRVLAAQLDLLGELGQALGVEGVVGVEMLDRGLVEAGQRHRFELEAVLRQVGGRDLLHLLDEIGALLVELVHRHPGGDRAERVDELALDQLLQALGCMVRRPSVWAAMAIDSRSGRTRT